MKKIESIENLEVGSPLKIRMKPFDNTNFYLARYYGTGKYINKDGTDYDYPILLAITPDGSIVRGDHSYFYLLDNEEELAALESEEAKVELPYFPYLLLEDGKYETTSEMTSHPLEYNFYPDPWWRLNHYLDINIQLFGNALAALLTNHYNEIYYYSSLVATNESKFISTYIPFKDYRYLALISKKQYTGKDFYNKHPYPFSGKSTQFIERPITINNDDFLVHFSSYFYDTMTLGEVANGEFSPYIPTKSDDGEIIFKNSDVEIAKKLINAIMDYKLRNRKPILDESDMEIILESLGVSKKRKQAELTYDLSQILDNLTHTIMQDTTVNKAFERSRKTPK